MVERFNAMLYYNSAEIDEAMEECFDYDVLVALLLAMWQSFYPDTDKYDLAFINAMAEDFAEEYLSI